MRLLTLKTWPEYFRAVEDGSKTFEVRYDLDRGFMVGDHLVIAEWDPRNGGQFTGKELEVEVTYKLHGGSFGVQPAFCVLAIRRVDGERSTKSPPQKGGDRGHR